MIHTPATLLAFATTRPLCRYLVMTHATLTRHRTSGAFDTNAALRLIRNNARDAAWAYCKLHRLQYWQNWFSDADLDRVAIGLLADWRLHN